MQLAQSCEISSYFDVTESVIWSFNMGLAVKFTCDLRPSHPLIVSRLQRQGATATAAAATPISPPAPSQSNSVAQRRCIPVRCSTSTLSIRSSPSPRDQGVSARLILVHISCCFRETS
eukprot:6176366-Pleurochrysis_carterae.AAC.3